MKVVKYMVIFFLISCCFTFCGETDRVEVEIFIQNKTDSLLHITLYPTKGESPMDGLYSACEKCGVYLLPEFYLYPNNERLLFLTVDLVKPYTLLSKAFDSIYISSTNKDSVIIKLTHKEVLGYSENNFTENSTWDLEIEKSNRPTQFKNNPVMEYKYKFLILRDKMTNNL